MISNSPLYRHDFVSLVSKREDIAEFSGNVVKRLEYKYKRMDYRKSEIVTSFWVCLELLKKTPSLEKAGRENGLLEINGSLLCISCMTSEYVRSDEKLNNGQFICSRCMTHFRGWK
jgi:hypothetical protein